LSDLLIWRFEDQDNFRRQKEKTPGLITEFCSMMKALAGVNKGFGQAGMEEELGGKVQNVPSEHAAATRCSDPGSD
jgi:hypothetical protein